MSSATVATTSLSAACALLLDPAPNESVELRDSQNRRPSRNFLGTVHFSHVSGEVSNVIPFLWQCASFEWANNNKEAEHAARTDLHGDQCSFFPTLIRKEILCFRLRRARCEYQPLFP